MKLPDVSVDAIRHHLYEHPVPSVQFFTIILGVLDVAFTADSFFPWPDEEFFLAMTVIALIFSVGILIGGKMYVSETTQAIDMTINLVMGAVLFIAAMIMLISAIVYDENISGFRVGERIFAAILGICNAGAFGFIGVTMLRELQNSIHPVTYKNSFIVLNWDRIRQTKYTGKLQVLAIMIGLVDLMMTGHSYYRRSEEGLFLSIVAICFMFSTIELLGTLLGFFKTADYSAYVVLAVVHSIAGLLLVSGGALMAVAATQYSEICAGNCNNTSYDERMACGVLGIVNGLLYGLIAYCWYARSQKSNQIPNQFEWDYEDLEPLIPERLEGNGPIVS
ncbi:unnamed protein product [Allacma fusca]|uniref:MARVEL domain-containing protein n=1 Tax=Allacma fusca TaxID=39272 RepID=A0A8J2LFK3_9HEXA|nr:unnamed protein product [Allacma fusca]